MNTKTKEIYNFQSETKEILKLMIHSLYSNKEIFLRELIANASDALDKIRFLSITNSNLNIYNTNLSITIECNKKEKTIIISDNGIGMNKKEVIENLGTIAKSGTKNFLSSLNKNNDNKTNLIGQFGVGFYSSFIVADHVTVHTRSVHNSPKEGILWQSHGTGEYSIEYKEKKEVGTSVILKLKEQNQEFLDHWRLKNIIQKYSEYINFSINIKNEKNELEQINKTQALWTHKRTEIKEKQYIEFYKNFTKTSEDPLLWIHNHVEGNQTYILLLYIPSKLSSLPWNQDKKNGIKLYIQKIFIMDGLETLLPNYLRFIKGIVDCNDLPLNISREILQNNKIIEILKKSITKKILNVLEKISVTDQKKYTTFWKNFGTIFKEGPAEDINNRITILKLLRFHSIQHHNEEQYISLENYKKNMVPEQKNIYFITGDNYISASNSPHLEIFKKNNIDVLILSDKVDEWMVNYLIDFEGIKFQSVTKHDQNLNLLFKNHDNKEEIPIEIKQLIEKIKNILKNEIKDVQPTYKLTDTPAVLVPDTNEMSTQMAKLFIAVGQKVPPIKYILEINPKHFLIKKMSKMTDEKEITLWIQMLFDQTVLIEKGSVDNPNAFIARINHILNF
ncbi:molecular chaperone HtpG [Buchnera aphidicola (Thelaxes californica)]|uniref:Chaperone protein HtpG n=1 Tax=Buchnera aphidicola (Thelaxes californica) TaxID=1315998 RepID=A0A4D6YFK5_9GAMM|nr:molecular chaperone HtpG [Buchnera aphidicola]QCI26893.1 molecular chaperone HtpG [Buchnera aphidicola (Thelaxes californica)]